MTRFIFTISITLFLTGVTVFTYWELPNTFFQQDEWWGFGGVIQRDATGGVVQVIKDSVFTAGKVHFNPFTAVTKYFLYKIFGLEFSYYAFVSIGMHLVNTVLVFVFLRMLTKNAYISFFTGLLFAVNSISNQAVTWIATSINTQGSAMFFLLSIISFLSYLRSKKQKFILLAFSFSSIIIATLFKEIILPFLLIPVLWYFYKEEKNLDSTKKVFFSLITVFAVYIFIRIFVYFISASAVPNAPQIGQQQGLSVYVYRLSTLPFKVITQSIFPQSTLVSWSDKIVKLAYPSFIDSNGAVNPYISQTIVFDYLGYLIGAILFIITIMSFILLKKLKEYSLANGLIISLCIMIAGALPIIFLPGSAGYASIIEPRHLYIGSTGSGLLIVTVIYSIFHFLFKQKKQGIILTSIILLCLISFHSLTTRDDIEKLEQISFFRKLFLLKTEKAYPKLPPTVIFYTESNKTYYGQPDTEKFLPVQFGFGKILMIWYQKKEQLPICLYERAFLDDLLSQGYRFCNGRGFGYFRDYDKLVEAIKANGIDTQSIIAYSWNSSSMEFSDITQNIRKKVNDTLEN